GPVTVAAESIPYEAPAQPVPASARPTRAAAPTAVPVRPADAATGPIGVLPALSAPGVNPTASQPARIGMRGRLNAMLGLALAPKANSLEMRLRDAQATIAGPLPESAVITFVNLKGGVGKTPMSIA